VKTLPTAEVNVMGLKVADLSDTFFPGFAISLTTPISTSLLLFYKQSSGLYKCNKTNIRKGHIFKIAQLI
jgi:hypothetical protein